jgi:hypothetical protein
VNPPTEKKLRSIKSGPNRKRRKDAERSFSPPIPSACLTLTQQSRLPTPALDRLSWERGRSLGSKQEGETIPRQTVPPYPAC